MKLTLIQLYNTFVQQGQIWYRKKRKMAYASTTLTSLAACIPSNLGVEVTLIDEGVEIVNLSQIDADVVGLSVMSPNAPRAYKICDYFKKKGVTTVMGGFHATLRPNEAAKYADSVVIGFAEKSLPKLLQDIQNNRLKKFYNEPPDEYFETEMPIPLRAYLKRDRYLLPDSMELTRGCMNHCNFCSIPDFCKRKFLKRDITQVVEELTLLKGSRITFLDSSPTEDIEYIKELYRQIIPLNLKWYSSATMKLAEDDAWLELAAQSGCKGVLIGFESMNSESLKYEQKGFNQVGLYKQFIKKLHSKNIAVLGCFVFGFDSDYDDIFKKTTAFVDKAKLDLVHYSINTPFPGTKGYKKLNSENRILTNNWSLYDGSHVVFQPANMSINSLQNGYYWAFKQSHTLSSILHRSLGSKARTAYSFFGNLLFRHLSSVMVPNSFKYKSYNA